MLPCTWSLTSAPRRNGHQAWPGFDPEADAFARICGFSGQLSARECARASRWAVAVNPKPSVGWMCLTAGIAQRAKICATQELISRLHLARNRPLHIGVRVKLLIGLV
jgi:hypothetical protein